MGWGMGFWASGHFEAVARGALLGGLLLVLMAGCRKEPSDAGHEVSLAESHGLAAHRPESFAAAVPILSERFAVLAGTGAGSAFPGGQPGLAEFVDIVRWLPELAGDSDLGREDWYRVKATAEDLERMISGWGPQGGREDWRVTTEDRERFAKAIAVLEPLREKSNMFLGRQERTGEEENPGE